MDKCKNCIHSHNSVWCINWCSIKELYVPKPKNKEIDYWKEKYEKLEQLLKHQEGCKYCIDVNSNQHSRCSKCSNKEHWFFDESLLREKQ